MPCVPPIEGGTRMRTGRPIPPLTLTADERDTLERWARRPTTARALAERARLVLECAGGKSNTVVARELRLTKQTIGKWRTRFLSQRLDGLLHELRRVASPWSNSFGSERSGRKYPGAEPAPCVEHEAVAHPPGSSHFTRTS